MFRWGGINKTAAHRGRSDLCDEKRLDLMAMSVLVFSSKRSVETSVSGMVPRYDFGDRLLPFLGDT